MVMADIKKLEVPEPLSRLGEAFREAGHELYLVGGYVRDSAARSVRHLEAQIDP